MKYDIAVVGGGAAGMCAAIAAKRKCRKLKIAVIEALDRVGKKLITTGNGRCNITNRFPDISRYHGSDVGFAEKVFEACAVDDTVCFFSSVGVEIVFSEDGRAYPASFQASSVVDALRFSLGECGVETLCSCRVNDIVPDANEILLKTTLGDISARAVVLAPGLLSGGAKVGSDGSVFAILKRLGYSFVEPAPSLVQLKTVTDVTRQLKGIRFDCGVSLLENGRTLKSEYGELLFTEYGLSGPPVFQLSREVSLRKSKFEISLDLAPDFSKSRLFRMLLQRQKALFSRNAEEFLTGFLNKRVGQVILRKCGVTAGTKVGDMSEHSLSEAARMIKDFRFSVTGTTGFANSQVSSGGIAVSEFSPETLESRRHPGIFAAGELLDIDGDCGGFNLQWAWSSAMVAAKNAAERAKT